MKKITYLRFSVTDRCNFRCFYCIRNAALIKEKDMLSLKDYSYLLRCFHNMGVKNLKITGGEPLLKKGIENFVDQGIKVFGQNNVSITTNGFFLLDKAERLYEKGLLKYNISLDTLDKDKMKTLSGIDISLELIKKGIDIIKHLPGTQVKLNTLIIKDFNDNEIIPLIKYAFSKNIVIRFIEYMPFCNKYSMLSMKNIKKIITSYFGKLTRIIKNFGPGPAVYYKIGENIIGFISPISDGFCSECNRVRIRSDGKLFYCLSRNDYIDISDSIRKRKLNNSMEFLYEKIKRKKIEQSGFSASEEISLACIGG